MKNKIFIIVFSLIMAISLGLFLGNTVNAEPCQLDPFCNNCVKITHNCCKNCKETCPDCKKNCKQCENCCEHCKTKK